MNEQPADDGLSPTASDKRPGLRQSLRPPKRPMTSEEIVDGCIRLKNRLVAVEDRIDSIVSAIRDLKQELQRHYDNDHKIWLGGKNESNGDRYRNGEADSKSS